MKRPKPKPEVDSEPYDRVEQARQAALKLLVRREHSVFELCQKLLLRDIPIDIAETAVRLLAQDGSQSDARFTEMYVRTRVGRGYGPLRIGAELRERGVDAELIEGELQAWQGLWSQRAEQARCKRFGRKRPSDWTERARQARFLQYRGFSAEQVRALLNDRSDT